MILTRHSQFSDRQLITATTLSTDVKDLGVPGTPVRATAPLEQDIGKGRPIPLYFQINEAFNNLTSLTVTIEVGAVDTVLGTVIHTQVFTLAQLVIGAGFNYDFVPKGATGRYLGLRYTVAGTAPTVGRVSAGISMGNQTNF